MMKLELRKVKICKWMSEETTCFTAEMVFDGEVIGTVENEGHGGANTYHFLDNRIGDVFFAFFKSLPPTPFSGMTLPMDADLFIGELLAEYEENKQVQRWCKKQTVFRLPGDERGSYHNVNHPYDEKVKAFIVSKYPGAEIMNERFVA